MQIAQGSVSQASVALVGYEMLPDTCEMALICVVTFTVLQCYSVTSPKLEMPSCYIFPNKSQLAVTGGLQSLSI